MQSCGLQTTVHLQTSLGLHFHDTIKQHIKVELTQCYCQHYASVYYTSRPIHFQSFKYYSFSTRLENHVVQYCLSVQVIVHGTMAYRDILFSPKKNATSLQIRRPSETRVTACSRIAQTQPAGLHHPSFPYCAILPD